MQGATPQPTRPWAVPALAALVAVAVTLVALASIRGLESTTYKLLHESYENKTLSGRLRIYVEMQASATRAFLLTQDAAFLDQSRRAGGLILATLDTLEGNRLDADARAFTARLRRDQGRYDSILPAAVAKGLRDAPLRERSSFLLREILPVKTALDSSATALLAHHAKQHAENMTASERKSRRAMLLILLTCGGGLLLASLLAFVINRRLRRAQIQRDRYIAEAREAEDKLQAQVALIGTIALNTSLALFLEDETGCLTYMNQAAEALTGYTLEEARGHSLHAQLHPERKDGRVYGLEECITAKPFTTGTRTRGEDFFRRKDGVFIPVAVTSSPVLDRGKVTGVVIEAEDITERTAQEEALLRSDERFRILSRATNDAVYDWDIASGRIWWNEGLGTLFGYGEGGPDPNFKWWMEKVHSEDRERVYRSLMTFIADGAESWQAEYRFLCADGAYKNVFDRGFLLRNRERSPIRLIGAMMDFTARMRAEAELRRFHMLVEQSNDFIAMGDLEGRCLFLNAGGRRLAGVEETAGTGHVMDYLFEADHEKAMRICRAAAREGQWLGELNLRHRLTGKSIPVMWNIFSVREPGNGRVTMAAVGRDMTLLQEQEEQLRQGQKMEAIGKLAGGIAHDFNNILTVINGYGELLRGGLAPEDPNRHLLDAMLDSGKRAASLTSQLLAYGRKQVLQPRVLDLNEVVEGTAVMLRRLIGEHIELRLRLDRGIPKVKADPVQIDQILINLCLNARDAMEKGGALLIETGWTHLAMGLQSRFGDLVSGTYATLTVVDNGLGMPEDVVERIFEPFFTTKETGKGSGLGLSSAYGIIRQSGGGIEVRSRPGEGSTFRVYLPSLSRPEEARPGPEAATKGTDGVTGRVLLVEDEAHVRTITRNLLEHGGFQVWEACDGVDALALYDRMQPAPDLVLTDVLMPRMGGRMLAVEVRKRKPDQKILFMSGYSEETLPESDTSQPGFYFLQKPFTSQTLNQAIQQALHAEPVSGGG